MNQSIVGSKDVQSLEISISISIIKTEKKQSKAISLRIELKLTTPPQTLMVQKLYSVRRYYSTVTA